MNKENIIMNENNNNDEYEKLENWKQFQGTELGGLLKSIYGQQRPKVVLPKPKGGAKPLPPYMIPAGGLNDPRKCTKKQVNVAVPKFSGRTQSSSSEEEEYSFMKYHALAAIPRRRSENIIRNEIEEIKFRQEHYRPGNVKAISSDAEKDRLAQMFIHHGAKTSILPKAFGLQPVGEAPFERIEKLKEQELRDNFRIKRGLKPNNNKVITQQLSANEQLAEQISMEINERNDFLKELRAANTGTKPSQQELQIMAEISQRVRELKEIDI